MGKPVKLTKLTTGKTIGATVNKGFAETFNWLVDYCNNLCGDGTYIEVQNPFGDFPMITFGDNPPSGYVGGGGGSEYKPFPAPFDFEYKEVTTTTTDPVTGETVQTTTNEPFITNCVWFFGREHKNLTVSNPSPTEFQIDPALFPSANGATMWLKIKYDQSSPSIIQPLTVEIVYGALSSVSTLAYPTDTSGTTPVQGNTDTITYFPIWNLEKSTDQTTQETTVTPIFDWRPTWKTPFYSN